MKAVRLNQRLQTVGGAIPMENWRVYWHFCDKHDRLSWLKLSVSWAGKQSTQKSLSLKTSIAKKKNWNFRFFFLLFSYSIFTKLSQLTYPKLKMRAFLILVFTDQQLLHCQHSGALLLLPISAVLLYQCRSKMQISPIVSLTPTALLKSGPKYSLVPGVSKPWTIAPPPLNC